MLVILSSVFPIMFSKYLFLEVVKDKKKSLRYTFFTVFHNYSPFKEMDGYGFTHVGLTDDL